MIDLFIGDDVFRQKALIGYLDKLIGFYMRNVQGSDEDENQLISDHKKIEKVY
jgi:hypothetical protein